MAKPGTFQKGKSPNPGGRPRTITEVQKLARKQTTRAVEILADAMENATKLHMTMAGGVEHPDYRVKVAAAEALLSRGWGSPHRAEVVEQSDAEQAHILTLQAKKLEAETRLLEQRIAAGDAGEGASVDPNDEAAAKLMRDRFGESALYANGSGETH